MTRRGPTNQLGIPVALGAIVLVLIAGVMVAGLAYTPVERGTVVLIKQFGGLTGQVFKPGLHWRIPFIEQIETVSTAIRSYETSADPGASSANYRDYPVTAQTVDGQQIDIKYTVIFRIQPEHAVGVMQDIGVMNEVVANVVKAHSRNLARLWAQSHTAEDLYSGEGIFAYEDEVGGALTIEFERYGVTLDDFLVRKIDFDEDYIRAIEQQQIAEEAIETARYQSEAAEYEKEQQIRMAEADAEGIKLQAAANAERQRLLADSEAYSIQARATADAERQRLLADSEAYSIRARGEALEEFPGLVQWEFVRNLESIQWGILPSEGITPLIPLPSFGQGEEPLSLSTP